MTEDSIGRIVVDTALQIHRDLGPGLLESVYEVRLADQLAKRGLRIERQVPVPVVYRGLAFEEAFRADMIVAQKVLLELKCVEKTNNAHKKQLLTYLRLTGIKLGLLLNFAEPLMRDGITRVVNRLEENR